MVAGWDHLLPEWFTRLHPIYKTPVNSVLFVGGVAFGAAIVALIGVGADEAYELLLIWSFTFYGIAYLAMFAIPLVAHKSRGLRPKLWLRLAAASGFLVTLLFVLLSAFPIIKVPNQMAYTLKTVVVILGANTIGLLIYRVRSRKVTHRAVK
jgi:amino acid transporter